MDRTQAVATAATSFMLCSGIALVVYSQARGESLRAERTKHRAEVAQLTARIETERQRLREVQAAQVRERQELQRQIDLARDDAERAEARLRAAEAVVAADPTLAGSRSLDTRSGSKAGRARAQGWAAGRPELWEPL